MDARELTAVLLLGVLLPVCFSRPPFLLQHPMRAHIRRRWNFAYSVTAFAAIGFVYVSGVDLLRPISGITQGVKGALGVAGLILFMIGCANHLPPLLTPTRPRAAVICGTAGSLILGLVLGGFVAVDAIFARVRYPWFAVVSWGVLSGLIVALMFWHSGLSPEDQLALYARRRRRRRRRNANQKLPGVASLRAPRRGRRPARVSSLRTHKQPGDR